MERDFNVSELREMCYRQSKIPGEFMLQLRCPGNYIDSKWLPMFQHICDTWGNGHFHIGTRMMACFPGIRGEDIPEINKYIAPYIQEVDIDGCGVEMDAEGGYPHIGPRNIVACIGGEHCIKANINTQEIARKIEPLIYPSPYHVKVCISGCPNDCSLAQFHDIGIVGVTLPVYDQDRCIGCGACVRRCEKAATRVLSMNSENKVDKDLCCCVGCGECVTACPTRAWSRQDRVFYKMYIGGRSGKQSPRMGKLFANWLSEDALLGIIGNWTKFAKFVLGDEKPYLHGGHLIDRVGYQVFKEKILEGVELNEEALIADEVYWHEQEYRSNFHLRPIGDHPTVYEKRVDVDSRS